MSRKLTIQDFDSKIENQIAGEFSETVWKEIVAVSHIISGVVSYLVRYKVDGDLVVWPYDFIGDALHKYNLI